MNEQLQRILAETLGIDMENVTPALNREAEDAWDSLNHLRLITAVEEAFGVRLSMAEIQRIATAADLEQCLIAYEAA